MDFLSMAWCVSLGVASSLFFIQQIAELPIYIFHE